jgi:hypothetical protein
MISRAPPNAQRCLNLAAPRKCDTPVAHNKRGALHEVFVKGGAFTAAFRRGKLSVRAATVHS